MTIIYRDEGGIVSEEITLDGIDPYQIDFCDGYMYFTSDEIDEDGYKTERKIHLSALVRIMA